MRKALIAISPELIGDFCRNGERHIKVESGLPDDAKFVGANWDSGFQWFLVCFESAEFEDIPEGMQLPQLKPVSRSIGA